MRDADIKRLAEEIIVFLEASDVAVEKRAEARKDLTPWERDYRWADRCVPLVEEAAVDEHYLIPDPGELMFWPKWTPIASFDSGEADGWGKGALLVSAFQPCSPRDARGYGATLYAPKMALHRFAAIAPSGDRRAKTTPVMHRSGKWLPARPPRIAWTSAPRGDDIPATVIDYNVDRGIRDHFNEKYRVMEGVLLSLRYRWTATLRFTGSIGVRLPLQSCAAVPGIFKLREVPAGKIRRAAIRHWVETHWRATSTDETKDALALVRGHLRGGTRFRWWGLEVEIDPSDYDIERVEELKAWREEMRAAGLDRREGAPR